MVNWVCNFLFMGEKKVMIFGFFVIWCDRFVKLVRWW